MSDGPDSMSRIETALFETSPSPPPKADNGPGGLPKTAIKEKKAGGKDPWDGLGLSICAEIAKCLNGSIELENRQQGGLSFKYRQALC